MSGISLRASRTTTSLAHDDKGHQHAAYPMAFEVEGDRELRAGVGESVDGDVDLGSYRSVDAADAPPARCVDAGDLGGDRAVGETDATYRDAVVTDARLLRRREVAVKDALLSFMETARVGGMVVDVRSGSGHFYSGGHCGHRPVAAATASLANRSRYSGHPWSASIPSRAASQPGPCRSR